MGVIDLDESVKIKNQTVVGLGNFDGLHLGHQALLERTMFLSRKLKLESSILLFKDHTRNLLESNDLSLLTSTEDKITYLDNKLENIFLIKFNDNIMKMSAEKFIKDILLNKCLAKAVVVGKDYKFGHKAAAGVDELKKLSIKYKFNLSLVDDFSLESELVSSTKIKNMISNGLIRKANDRLGREYFIKGIVVSGDGRGKLLGYPTANISLDFNYIIPKDGVYFGKAKIGNICKFCLISIGKNPTFNGKELRIEVYIYDFDRNIYGEELKINFIDYLRPTYNFSSKKDLIKQMNKDKKEGILKKTFYIQGKIWYNLQDNTLTLVFGYQPLRGQTRIRRNLC